MSAGSGLLHHLAACNPPIREPLLPFAIDHTAGVVMQCRQAREQLERLGG